jgi:hypothetical protein
VDTPEKTGAADTTEKPAGEGTPEKPVEDGNAGGDTAKADSEAAKET